MSRGSSSTFLSTHTHIHFIHPPLANELININQMALRLNFESPLTQGGVSWPFLRPDRVVDMLWYQHAEVGGGNPCCFEDPH